jgi:DNA-3-methyladenine glycosylase I
MAKPKGAQVTRCDWAGSEPIYVEYHDKEWGVPVLDDRILFEFLLLEGAQAGLSWLTVLRKRDGYRQAFGNFEAEKVARFNANRLAALAENPNIVRNRAKIASTVKNAKAFLRIQEEFGSFSAYQWRFVEGRPIQNRWTRIDQIPAKTSISDQFSKDLKQRGFSFVGSTIVYAHMQAVGMVNDHLVSCFRHEAVAKLGRRVR